MSDPTLQLDANHPLLEASEPEGAGVLAGAGAGVVSEDVGLLVVGALEVVGLLAVGPSTLGLAVGVSTGSVVASNWFQMVSPLQMSATTASAITFEQSKAFVAGAKSVSLHLATTQLTQASSFKLTLQVKLVVFPDPGNVVTSVLQ